MITMPPKDPEEVQDYQFRWNLDAGETLLTSVETVVGGDATLDVSKTHGITDAVNNIVTFWLVGGTVAGGPVLVLNKVTTSKFRTYEQTAKIRMREK